MYEDTWYSFVQDAKAKKDDAIVQKPRHRKESFLKQSSGLDHGGSGQGQHYDSSFDVSPMLRGPPEPKLSRRARSYSDFYHVVRAQFTEGSSSIRQRERESSCVVLKPVRLIDLDSRYDDWLLDASQEEFQVYKDQLALSERHLDSLLDNTSSALDLLATLSCSFEAVGGQTTAFQAQCEDLLAEQKRLKTLSDEIGTHLQYYSYLEPITRRLNAPGASRMLGDDSLVEMLTSLNACIEFMIDHPDHRESETYLTRYKSLLARTLNLIQIKFAQIIKETTSELQKRTSEGKLTMTSVYLIQAPGTALTSRQLERAMEWIIRQASIAFDDSHRSELPRARSANRDHLATYHALFKTMMEMYVDSRRQIIPGIVQIMLNKSRSQKSSQEGFPIYARECLDMVLEICSNEHSKYAMMFLGRAELAKHAEKNAFYHFWVDQGIFHTFLQDLCGQAVTALEGDLRNANIPSGINLILWLDAHYDYAASDEGIDTEVEEDPGGGRLKPVVIASDVQIKARLADEIKAKIISGIFSRMRVVLLKNIENYIAKADDLKPQRATLGKDAEVVDEGREQQPADTDVDERAEKALGPGYSNAYPALKTAIQLLIFYNDLTFDLKGLTTDKGEMAYEIMHGACNAIMRAANAVAAKYTQIDGRIFAIKNLVLLKNLVLAYEISGSRQASALDFSRMWATFSELRSRGGLFDVSAYYVLLRNGKLLPEVVMSVQDARTELDGLLRETIIQFREGCANMLWNEKSRGPTKDAWKVKEGLQAKLGVMFSHEEQLRDNLWAAVEETLLEKQRRA